MEPSRSKLLSVTWLLQNPLGRSEYVSLEIEWVIHVDKYNYSMKINTYKEQLDDRYTLDNQYFIRPRI